MRVTQATIDTILQCITAIAAAVAAYYGSRNHSTGTSNAAKLDQLTATKDN